MDAIQIRDAIEKELEASDIEVIGRCAGGGYASTELNYKDRSFTVEVQPYTYLVDKDAIPKALVATIKFPFPNARSVTKNHFSVGDKVSGTKYSVSIHKSYNTNN